MVGIRRVVVGVVDAVVVVMGRRIGGPSKTVNWTKVMQFCIYLDI